MFRYSHCSARASYGTRSPCLCHGCGGQADNLSHLTGTLATGQLLYSRRWKRRPVYFWNAEGAQVRFAETRPPSCGAGRNCREVPGPVAPGSLKRPSYPERAPFGRKRRGCLLSVPKKCEIELVKIRRRFREDPLLFQEK